jgi:transposase
MLGRQDRDQGTLFITGSLKDLIPDDHILKRVDKILDLSWLRKEVEDCYCLDNGRPGIDPEAAVRLMLAGFFQGIVLDRKLMREAQVNVAIRWFAGYRLDEKLPDHSSLTRIRQRWGPERFQLVFQKTIEACIAHDLVGGETMHIDATLIRADVSWASVSAKHAEKVLAENPSADDSEEASSKENTSDAEEGARRRTKSEKPKKRSKTDPDCTLATSRKNQKLEPSYKQHGATDDKAGVITDVELTTGEINEGTRLIQAVERIEATTGKKVERVTADTGYAHPMNYQALEERGTDAIIPPARERKNPKNIPLRRFKYDAKHEIVRCPGGKTLRRSTRRANGWVYRAKACDCRECPLRQRCVPRTAKARTVLIVDGYESLLRARRRRHRWDEDTKNWYSRHRWRAEGIHGEAKTQHGLRRAARRGLANVAIQVYLTAAVMNLKRLAAFLFRFLLLCVRGLGHPDDPRATLPAASRPMGHSRQNPPGRAQAA